MIGDAFLDLENHRNEKKNHRNEKRSQFSLKIDKTALKYSLQGKNFKDATSVKPIFLNKKYPPSKLLQAFPLKHKNQAIAIKILLHFTCPHLCFFYFE
ncbi:hypothetical protein [Bartonella grahamii]|uniref:hypothetical protein n=1 Tax=Bartonella grahamii TaxID=33045 RepID=UPI002E7C5425|nr:hypothetical protein [Bartonella grahamii]